MTTRKASDFREKLSRVVLAALIAGATLGELTRVGAQEVQYDPAAGGEATSTAPQRDPPTHYLGREIARTMHYSGANWLVRESREREEEPRKLLAALKLQRGQTVCDMGCGNGFYTLLLAERVGPHGRVFAVDIQPEMLDMLAERAQARGIPNIRRVIGTATDPRLPADTFDLILAVDVYHEFSHPAEMLQAMHRSLRPRGRLVLVEFRLEDPEVPIKLLHKMSQPQIMRELAANDFKLVGQSDELPWQHVLEFARADSPLAEVPLRRWQPPANAAADTETPN